MALPWAETLLKGERPGSPEGWYLWSLLLSPLPSEFMRMKPLCSHQSYSWIHAQGTSSWNMLWELKI